MCVHTPSSVKVKTPEPPPVLPEAPKLADASTARKDNAAVNPVGVYGGTLLSRGYNVPGQSLLSSPSSLSSISGS